MGQSVLLTVEQVEEWREQHATIQRQIVELQSKQVELKAKLDAAAFFLTPAHQSVLEKPLIPDSVSSGSGSGIGLPDAIIQVVREAKGPVSNTQIKRKLLATGFDVTRLEQSPNYFYTVTKRLAKRGAIKKLRNGSYVATKSAETPEGPPHKMDPPEASNHDRVDFPIEPGAQGREAGPGGGT